MASFEDLQEHFGDRPTLQQQLQCIRDEEETFWDLPTLGEIERKIEEQRIKMLEKLRELSEINRRLQRSRTSRVPHGWIFFRCFPSTSSAVEEIKRVQEEEKKRLQEEERRREVREKELIKRVLEEQRTFLQGRYRKTTYVGRYRKTTYVYQVSSSNESIPKQPQYSTEASRVATFTSVDHVRPVDKDGFPPHQLAEQGLYYDRNGAKCRCFYCGEKFRLNKYKNCDAVLKDHIRKSPGCPHLLETRGKGKRCILDIQNSFINKCGIGDGNSTAQSTGSSHAGQGMDGATGGGPGPSSSERSSRPSADRDGSGGSGDREGDPSATGRNRSGETTDAGYYLSATPGQIRDGTASIEVRVGPQKWRAAQREQSLSLLPPSKGSRLLVRCFPTGNQNGWEPAPGSITQMISTHKLIDGKSLCFSFIPKANLQQGAGECKFIVEACHCKAGLGPTWNDEEENERVTRFDIILPGQEIDSLRTLNAHLQDQICHLQDQICHLQDQICQLQMDRIVFQAQFNKMEKEIKQLKNSREMFNQMPPSNN